jgi:hypothetical protein
LAIVDEYISDMPSASNDELMVLAVYMPPHEPLDGQAFFSMPSKSSFDMRPAVEFAHRFERRHDGQIHALSSCPA